YGGTLTVTNVAGSLAAGNTFTLFNAANYSGGFAPGNLRLPALSAGLVWNTSSLGVNGSISVVAQALTTITVMPGGASVGPSGTQQFTAAGYDQFGNPMQVAPSISWSVAGSGSINSAGLYTAPYFASTATVKAAGGSVIGTASVTVT